MRDRTSVRRADARPTIGLVLNSITDPRDSTVWSAAIAACRESQVNLVCFPGGLGDGPDGVLYDLATSERIDGLVVHLYADMQGFLRIHRRCSSLPAVNLLRLHQGYAGVVADDYQGMRDLIHHLVERHGYRRIAFVRGPQGDISADERYRAYADALSDFGLPFDPGLVCALEDGGHFTAQSGQDAVRTLLDERKTSVDVIVTSADSMALGAIRALDERGIRVPHDIGVTGFDDVYRSRFATPPLTTVAQPWREMCRQAVGLLLAQLKSDQVAEQTIVPCELVVRQSCGCWPSLVNDAGTDGITRAAWSVPRQIAVSQMANELRDEAPRVSADSLEQLADAFEAALAGSQQDAFLATLDTILRRVMSEDGDVSLWQGVLSVLRRSFGSSGNSDGVAQGRAASLLGQARVLVSEIVQRALVQQTMRADQQAEKIRQVGESLTAATDWASLSAMVVRELPQIGIPGFGLSVYDGPSELREWSRMIVAYDEKGRFELGAEGQRFHTRRLFPVSDWPTEGIRSFLVKALHAEGKHFGVALFELGPVDAQLYDTLAGHLAAAVRGISLVQQTQRRALQLQTAAEVGRVVSGLLDANELMQRVVDLALERLDLYYAGVFLIDSSGEWTGEAGRWAVLRAGTGQAGRQMVANGHRLEIGGPSMVGQCIAHRKARIALDAGQETLRFENPLLPYTRSELALPLIGRGQTIGAMTIQSTVPFAFSDEDIAALQLMADQLANATQTANVFAESQETLERIQALYETSQALSSSLEEATLMRAILESISGRLGCEYAVISVVDEQAGAMESRYALYRGEYGVFPEWTGATKYPLDGPYVLSEVYRTGRTEIIEDQGDRADGEGIQGAEQKGLLCILMPIRLGDKTMGVVEVGFDRGKRAHLGEGHVRLLHALVDQTAVALENARLLDETQRTLDETKTLYVTSRKLSEADDASAIVSAVATGLQIGAVNRALLWSTEIDSQGNIAAFVCSAVWHRGDGPHPFPVGTRLLAEQFPSTREVFGTEPLYLRDACADERLDDGLRALLRREQIRCLAMHPLQTSHRLWGTLMLAGEEVASFSERDSRLLESLSGQMANGLERLGLMAQLQAQLRHEEILRKVSNRVRGAVDVETVMRAAVREVGGAFDRAAFVYLGEQDTEQGI